MSWLVKIIISWLLVLGFSGSWTISHRRFAWLRNWRWGHQWAVSIRILDWRWVEINRSIWFLPPSWYWSADLSWPSGRSDTRSARVRLVDGLPSSPRNFCDRWTCNWGWSRLAWFSIVAHQSRPRERCLLSGLKGKYFHLLFVGIALLGCLERVCFFHLFFCLFGHVSYNYYGKKNRMIVKSEEWVYFGFFLGIFWKEKGSDRIHLLQLTQICDNCFTFAFIFSWLAGWLKQEIPSKGQFCPSDSSLVDPKKLPIFTDKRLNPQTNTLQSLTSLPFNLLPYSAPNPTTNISKTEPISFF